MQIEKDRVVTLGYTVTDEEGTLIDRSEGEESFSYIQGAGSILPGLEAALEGHRAGEEFSLTLAPADAYGERKESLLEVVPRDRFQTENDLTVGMHFQTPTERGVRVVTVTDIAEDTVTVDTNHPLAGKTLNFDLSIVEVREATEQELRERMKP
jgi:FKBP-type peptidyl-prolyl cis-trans isomerase SlyD